MAASSADETGSCSSDESPRTAVAISHPAVILTELYSHKCSVGNCSFRALLWEVFYEKVHFSKLYFNLRNAHSLVRGARQTVGYE